MVLAMTVQGALGNGNLPGILFSSGGCMLLLILVFGRLGRYLERYQQDLEASLADTRDLALIALVTDNPVIVTDRAGRITWVNPGFTRMMGYTLDEARGQSPGQLLHGERTDPKTVEWLRVALQKGDPVRVELLNYAKDGREYWWDMQIQPIRDEDGEIRQFIAINAEISQRKRQEEELSQARSFLRTVIDYLPVALFVKDYKDGSDGRYRLWNRKANELFGHDAESAVGRNDFDFFPPEQASFFRAKDLETFRDGQVLDIPVEPIDSHTLGPRLLHTVKVPVFDEHGGRDYLLGISEDITERERVADQLRRLASFQEQLLDTIPNPIFYKDVEGVYQGCNRAFEDFLGYRRDEIVGHTVLDLSPTELARLYHSQDLQLMVEGGAQGYECSVRHADGSLHQIMFQKATFNDVAGAVAGMVGVMIDITATKRYQEQLADEKSRLRALIDSIPDLIFFKDANGVYLGCNKAFSALIGRPEAEQVGKTDFNLVDFETASFFRQKDQEMMASGQPNSNEEWVTYPDGRQVLLDTLKTSYYDENGLLLGLIGISRDITERRQVLEELRQAKENAEAANRAKSVFLATMSHEIRTPLTSIIGFAELLTDPAAETISRSEAGHTILHHGKHLLSLINDILDHSKIEAGQLVLESISFSVFEILWSVDSVIGALARDKEITFHTVVRYPIPTQIVADPTRWKQILLNLCGNAVKFTARGGVTLTISYDQASSVLKCGVVDSGIGLSAEQMSNLFQPFTQADDSITRKYGGTGLGLHLVQHLAERMGGQVTLESEPGRGSEFTVCIAAPMADGAQLLSVAPQEATRSPADVKSLPAQMAGRILLAEDGPDNRKLIAAFLGKLGLDLAFAENGEQAVELALGGDFDLVLMDIQMPVLDGVGATQLLRAAGFDRPIIALTANVMTEDIERYLRSGCTHCVAKPIDFAALTRLLGELLRVGALDHSLALEYADLPGYAELKAGFENQFMCKLVRLEADMRNSDWGQARQLAHALAGTAGSFGYPAITVATRALERALADDQPEQARGVLRAMLDLAEVRHLCANDEVASSDKTNSQT